MVRWDRPSQSIRKWHECTIVILAVQTPSENLTDLGNPLLWLFARLPSSRLDGQKQRCLPAITDMISWFTNIVVSFSHSHFLLHCLVLPSLLFLFCRRFLLRRLVGAFSSPTVRHFLFCDSFSLFDSRPLIFPPCVFLLGRDPLNIKPLWSIVNHYQACLITMQTLLATGKPYESLSTNTSLLKGRQKNLLKNWWKLNTQTRWHGPIKAYWHPTTAPAEWFDTFVDFFGALFLEP